MDEQTESYYTIYPHVVNTLKAEGIDSRWADIVASQMMQESDWGRSSSAKENNFFGMKAGKNQPGTVYNTREGYVPMIFTANSDGHTDNLFYRYNYPKRILHNK